MNWQEWINNCIGLWGGGEYLDSLEKAFELSDYESEFDDDETKDIVYEYSKRGRLGDYLAMEIYRRVEEKAVEKLGASHDDFDYQANGMLDHWIMCKGEYVGCWLDIVAKYPQEEEDEK